MNIIFLILIYERIDGERERRRIYIRDFFSYSEYLRAFSLLSALNTYIKRVHFPSKLAKLPLDVVQLLSEFRKGVDMSGRNDFLPGSARSILTAELMAFPDVKVRRSNKELFGKRVACIFSRCRILTHLRVFFHRDIVPLTIFPR